MSEPTGADRVSAALASLHTETQQVWQKCTCLPCARLWKVALGQCAYVPAKRRHLAACLHCQRRAGEVERQAGVAGGKPAEAPRIFAPPSRWKPARRPSAPSPFPTIPIWPPS